MKIGILTQPLRYNYGGLLQNYALQTVLRRMGHEPVTLDPNQYIYTDWTTPLRVIKRTIWKYLFHKQSVGLIWEYRKNRDLRLLETNTGRFIRKHIKVQKYRRIEDTHPERFDAFIVGSDQVWRPMYNRKRLSNMFLDFAKGLNVKRIAYAASFGTSEWEFTDKDCQKCASLVKLFDGVSVREDSGGDLCREHLGIDALHVLDPTMLLTKDDYMQIINKSTVKPSEGSLYSCILDHNPENQKLVEDFSSSKKIKTYSYSSKVLDWKNPHSINERIQPPVELWLYGFNQAKYIITDSFHACVFSILFGKQFYFYGNADRGMSRFTSLLKFLGIENRMVKSIDDIENIGDIDYVKVNERLLQLREMSMDFLKNKLK